MTLPVTLCTHTVRTEASVRITAHQKSPSLPEAVCGIAEI